MAATLLPVLSVLFVVTSRLVVGQLPGTQGAWGIGTGHGFGYGGYGGGLHPSGSRPPRALSCSADLGDGRQLKVTVREGYPGGGLYGRPTAAFGASHLPLSPTFRALGGGVGMAGGGGWGWGMGLGQGGGLDIDLQVRLLRDIPSAYLVLTQFASPSPASCPAESFGQILSPSSSSPGHGFAGVGAMMMAHVQGSSGFLPPQAPGVRDPALSVPGILSRVSVTSGTSQTVRVTKVQGFRLDQLAGRGVIVCDSILYDWNWEPVCDTPVVDICCGLTYSNGATGTGSDHTYPPTGNGFSPSGVFPSTAFGPPPY